MQWLRAGGKAPIADPPLLSTTHLGRNGDISSGTAEAEEPQVTRNEFASAKEAAAAQRPLSCRIPVQGRCPEEFSKDCPFTML